MSLRFHSNTNNKNTTTSTSNSDYEKTFQDLLWSSKATDKEKEALNQQEKEKKLKTEEAKMQFESDKA